MKCSENNNKPGRGIYLACIGFLFLTLLIFVQYWQGCIYVGIDIGVMLNCIPSTSKAVFGLMRDFSVIVIADYAKLYCNAFIIVKP